MPRQYHSRKLGKQRGQHMKAGRKVTLNNGLFSTAPANPKLCAHWIYYSGGWRVSETLPGQLWAFTTCQFSPLMCKRKLTVHPHLFLGFLKHGLVELLLVWRGTWPGWSRSPQTWLSHWAHLWPLYLHISEAAPLSHEGVTLEQKSKQKEILPRFVLLVLKVGLGMLNSEPSAAEVLMINISQKHHIYSGLGYSVLSKFNWS